MLCSIYKDEEEDSFTLLLNLYDNEDEELNARRTKNKALAQESLSSLFLFFPQRYQEEGSRRKMFTYSACGRKTRLSNGAFFPSFFSIFLFWERRRTVRGGGILRGPPVLSTSAARDNSFLYVVLIVYYSSIGH